MNSHPSQALWVITSYFNPAGSARRLANYRTFRQHLNAPLLTVELASPGQHRLGAEDAERLIALHGNEFIWQKERLLNLAIGQLPPHVRHVAWVDCDVVFENKNWAAGAQAELDRNGGLLHLFARAVHLPAQITDVADREDLSAIAPIITEPSMGHAASHGRGVEALQACYNPQSRRIHGNISATGLALAARRDTLELCGLYDAAIVGGGDAMLICAALGQLDPEMLARQVNTHELAHITRWAAKARQAGLFSPFRHLEQTIYHLWHGELSARQYGRRHQITSSLGFDPATHLRRCANGTWEWTEPEGRLAKSVREYFLSRGEA